MQESYAIPTPKILERLQFENPWWSTGMPTEGMNLLPRRLYGVLGGQLIVGRALQRHDTFIGADLHVVCMHARHRYYRRLCVGVDGCVVGVLGRVARCVVARASA